MRKLNIALLLDAKVPVHRYGGTERQVVWLARELVRQGHAVTLVAKSGSYVPGVRMVYAKDASAAFALVPDDVDIVNSHGSVAPEDYPKPVLHTCHGLMPPPKKGEWSFVSRSHAERHGRKTYAYNGLPADEHYFSQNKNGRLLFFSRINRPGKGISRAIQLCKEHNKQLDIAGGNRADLLTRSKVRRERAFFRTLDARFRFHGMVGGWEKARLFAHAQALLFPIEWPEPFGLVVVEALMAGTPVITTSHGAMPELVGSEVGHICETDADFAHAIENMGNISPETCRAYAIENFSIEKSAARYVELYQRLLDGESLP